jgi:O-antigen/teichoic acid export membrane protein
LSAFRYNLLAAVVVWIALVIFSWLKIISRDLEINRLLRVFSISLFPATLSGLMLVYLQAMGKFKDISRVNISAKIGSLLLIIGFTFFFKINGYVAGSVSGGFFLMFLVFRIMRKNIGKISGRSVPDVWKIHWSLAGFSYFDLLIAQFANSIDIFLLNLLVNERNEIGQYSFATTVTAAMLIIIGTVQQIATPHLTFKAKNRSEWKQSFKKYNRHWLCACCLVSSMVLFGTPWLIGLVFKMKYFHFMLYFPVLWSAWFVKAGYSLVGPALISLGRTDVNFYTSLLKVLFAVTVTFHMIQKMGIVGAAYATLLVQLFGFVTEYGSLLLILKKSG